MAGVPAGVAAAVRAGGGGGQHHLREWGPEPQVRGHYVNSINTGLTHKDFLSCIVNYINKKNILDFYKNIDLFGPRGLLGSRHVHRSCCLFVRGNDDDMIKHLG